ncbi:MAG: bifunctional UDP-N-acetylglucosamine diphosphorylase/glucosamine-1-phosphate N-acetyltransferase GlmU [Marmoricola sp.]
MPSDLTVIVLAAGEGTRMRSRTAKVLHPIAGRSMIGHVIDAVAGLDPARVVAVVGHQREQVGPHIGSLHPGVVLAVQEAQLGTGHAVRTAWEALPAECRQGTVLVAYGDTPLLETGSLERFVAAHAGAGAAVSILSGLVEHPTGYGRVLRDPDGTVTGIVEERDATEEQRAITEINSGIFAFDARFLDSVLPRLGNDNAKREYYLTDAVGLARRDDRGVGAFPLDDVRQTEGVNDRAQLAEMAAEKNRRILDRWMRDGVTVADPATTWVDVDVRLAPDVTLLPGVQLLGATVVAEDAVVGPDCTLKNVEVGTGAKVVRTHAELAVIGERVSVGPFSYLRPGTEIGAGGKVGGFVETKNATLAEGAKVPHLSYVGDAEVGEGANIGAGTIFANYDGVNKHRTVVGRHAKTGANNTFVAPVRIGDGAGTGGGTVVRKDVPPGGLAVSSVQQRNLEGWAVRRRPGTEQAAAAEAADPCENGDATGSTSTDEAGSPDRSDAAEEQQP